MKKGIISFLILTAIFAPVLAGADEIKIDNPLGSTSTVPALLAKITNFIWFMALAVAPILILIGAYYFLTSAGDPEKVKIGKNTIIWTFVGLLVIFLSNALVDWMKTAVGIPSP